jgi:hypothetical protein
MRSTCLVLAGSLVAGALAVGACGGGGGDGGVYFDLASPLDTGDVFWDLPFPSDLRLNGDGTIDLTGFPNPRNVPLVEKLLIDARVRHGFPEMPVAYFRFRDPPPARSADDVIPAAATSDAFLVDVDPASPERGTMVPVVAQTFPVDGFAPANLVGVAPRPGFVLAPHTTYAVVLRQSFAPGVDPAPDFATLADGGTPGGDRGGAAHDLYQPLWDTLATLAVDPHDVLVATVFTTGDEVQVLYDRTEAIRAAHDAVIADLHVDPVDGASHDGFCEIVGTVTLPQFQVGTQPFDQDGEFVLDADGTPEQQGEMTVPMTISLPLATMPASGFPLYQFFHGSGGHSSDVVDLGRVTTPGGSPTVGEGPAFVVAKQGIAAAGDALPLNPERLPGAGDTEYLNINNLAAFPYTFQQGAIEQRLFLDALLALRIDPAAVTDLDQCEARGLALPSSATTYQFDPGKLVAGGQSMGGMYTNMIGAVEPRFGALVPTGAGGFWNLMVLETTLVPGAGALLAAAYQTDELQLTFMYPGMHLLGMAWEIAEPMVSMSRLARRPLPGTTPRSVYEPVGYDDIYFPTEIYDAAALAYGNQEAGDQVWPEMQGALALDGLDGLLTYPITGNHSDGTHTTTNVVVQYLGDGVDDPHYLYRQLDAVKHQYGCFLRSYLDTGTPTVPAAGALDDPCP